MFNVNADLFRAVSLFQSTEETRYYLCGVYIQPHPAGGAMLVATNGTMLLAAYDAEGRVDSPVIVNLDKPAMLACKRANRGELDPRRVTSDSPADPIWIESAIGEQLHICRDWLIDGTFPDWQRALPNVDAQPASSMFYGASLSQFEKAARIIKNDVGNCGVMLRHGAQGGPALIRFDRVDHAFGVVMPVKGQAPEAIPEWVSMKVLEKETV